MSGRYSSGLPGYFLSFVLLAACATSCKAQPSNKESASTEVAAACESYVTEKLSVWQKRLKLDDWNVTVSLTRASDLKPKTLGNIHWDSEKKQATIHVLDPSDYKMPYREMLDDMEFTVVHELIHLKLSPLLSTVTRSEASRRDEEHTVNNIADALLGK